MQEPHTYNIGLHKGRDESTKSGDFWSYLAEIHIDVLPGLLVQLRAADLLGKVGDADGVAGVQLLHQEVAAGLDHAVDLVHDRTVHDVDHTLLPHRDAGSIGKLDQPFHHLGYRRGKLKYE